ncbi:hypothetical protein C8R44DRAFT_57172 [Mycena epipterygia]|nr:hypothetical protein C8R44DRAFT_57172 [Mycena epipterygia]
MYSTASVPPGITTPPAAGTAHQPELPTSSSISSRLAHLLESNIPPLELEIPAIQQIIAENQTRVDALNVQIDVLRTAMARLIDEREEREKCVRKHTAVVSPIRRMPSELMREIFALTLPHTRQLGDMTANCAPWCLGHICRSWRDWALADPSLWCSIEIFNNHYSYPLSVETQLLRSGNMPLAVAFDSCDCENVVERRLWDFLLPLCDRWSIFRLRCRRERSNLSKQLDVVQGRIPQLKKLELIALPHDTRIPLNSFAIAPSLREVILTDYYIASPPTIHIPWG